MEQQELRSLKNILNPRGIHKGRSDLFIPLKWIKKEINEGKITH